MLIKISKIHIGGYAIIKTERRKNGLTFSVCKYRKISNCSRISNRSRPPNFQKITIFLQKVSYFENLQLKPHGNFCDLSRTKTIFISYKKDNDQVFIKTPVASYANRANRAHAI